ncbi:MAG: LytR/AlgR family response regulator transcription factor [Saprospiraceae bacterium]
MSSGKLLFKSGNFYYPLLQEQILYLSADGAYTNIHFGDRKISVSKSIKEASRYLDQEIFFRIHQSTIVNIDHINRISQMDDNIVEMINGERLSVAKSRKKEFLAHFTRI